MNVDKQLLSQNDGTLYKACLTSAGSEFLDNLCIDVEPQLTRFYEHPFIQRFFSAEKDPAVYYAVLRNVLFRPEFYEQRSVGDDESVDREMARALLHLYNNTVFEKAKKGVSAEQREQQRDDMASKINDLETDIIDKLYDDTTITTLEALARHPLVKARLPFPTTEPKPKEPKQPKPSKKTVEPTTQEEPAPRTRVRKTAAVGRVPFERIDNWVPEERAAAIHEVMDYLRTNRRAGYESFQRKNSSSRFFPCEKKTGCTVTRQPSRTRSTLCCM